MNTKSIVESTKWLLNHPFPCSYEMLPCYVLFVLLHKSAMLFSLRHKKWLMNLHSLTDPTKRTDIYVLL